MKRPARVFVLLLGGQERDAIAFARRRYPGRETSLLSKVELRESPWYVQLQKLWRLKGEALLIFVDSLLSLREPMLLQWTPLVHRCRETALADATGACEVSSKASLIGLLPRSTVRALADLIVFAYTWAGLHLFRAWLSLRGEPAVQAGAYDLAFLYPSQAGLDIPGGALTHMTGFLSGLAQERRRVAILSGQPLAAEGDLHHIPGSRRHLLREAATLAYNLRFVAAARKLLGNKRARLLYQRHGRFLFAGALLSRWLRTPLVLEYNASEDWMARHWDPVRFSAWLRLCETISVRAASLIVVVSDPLKQQLISAGVPEERILVNPNAVDPEWFRPGCGGAARREKLGFRPEDVVVCFVGTFGYWHGVDVLEQSIRLLLDSVQPTEHLRFLLVGDGLLAPRVRSALEPYARRELVNFTGPVPHRTVREYLDAADILVSPHVTMPGGQQFFGSPTKLFEYMAMGKAIAASALDQIAEVLEHGKTAWLVKPGDPVALAEAIRHLARDGDLRSELGRRSREVAVARHTWRQNARRVLACCDAILPRPDRESQTAAVTDEPYSRPPAPTRVAREDW